MLLPDSAEKHMSSDFPGVRGRGVLLGSPMLPPLQSHPGLTTGPAFWERFAQEDGKYRLAAI